MRRNLAPHGCSSCSLTVSRWRGSDACGNGISARRWRVRPAQILDSDGRESHGVASEYEASDKALSRIVAVEQLAGRRSILRFRSSLGLSQANDLQLTCKGPRNNPSASHNPSTSGGDQPPPTESWQQSTTPQGPLSGSMACWAALCAEPSLASTRPVLRANSDGRDRWASRDLETKKRPVRRCFGPCMASQFARRAASSRAWSFQSGSVSLG